MTPSSPSKLVEVSDAAFPIVMVRVPAALDDPAIDSMFSGMDRVLQRRARFATVVDTRAMKEFPSALGRQRIGKWMVEHTTAEALYNLGNAVVLSSQTARVVLTAIQWIRRPVTEQVMVTSTVAAIDWCCTRLKGASIPLPSTIDSLRAAELLRGFGATSK
jgi:hypothetical protein